MNRVTFFTKPDCTLCRSALFVVEKVRRTTTFELELIDISEPGQEKWFEAYKHDIPVVSPIEKQATGSDVQGDVAGLVAQLPVPVGAIIGHQLRVLRVEGEAPWRWTAGEDVPLTEPAAARETSLEENLAAVAGRGLQGVG